MRCLLWKTLWSLEAIFCTALVEKCSWTSSCWRTRWRFAADLLLPNEIFPLKKNRSRQNEVKCQICCFLILTWKIRHWEVRNSDAHHQPASNVDIIPWILFSYRLGGEKNPLPVSTRSLMARHPAIRRSVGKLPTRAEQIRNGFAPSDCPET